MISTAFRHGWVLAFTSAALACRPVMTPPPSPPIIQQLATSLDSALSYYIAKPDSLVALANRAAWNPGERKQRPACNGHSCSPAGPGDTADAQIDIPEVLNSTTLFWDGGRNGTIVARVINRGGRTERAFGVRPRGVVYVIAYSWRTGWAGNPNPPHEAPTLLVSVYRDIAGGPLKAEVLRAGTLRQCKPPIPHVPPYVGARFGGCAHGHGSELPIAPGAPWHGPSAPDGAEAVRIDSGDGQEHCGAYGCCEIA